jgi:16S rRNA (guanine527-N7)-methyltransferase
MKPERIAELLQPFLAPHAALQEIQLHNISTYIDILLKWNARMNLTAVRKPEEIVQRHFGESLFAARQLFADPAQQEKATRLLDIGSGAGFPGLPIKIWVPQVSVTLIEANQKKATFLREVIRLLILTNIDVFSGRAENYEGLANVVTLRAVEQYETTLLIAASKVVENGRLAFLIGESQVAKAQQLAPSVHWGDLVRVPGSTSRVVLIGRARYRHESHE